MKNFKDFNQEFTFEEYESILDSLLLHETLTENVISDVMKKSLGKVKNLYADIKKYIAPVAEELNLSLKHIIEGFKSKSFYDMFKHFKFSMSKLFKALNEATKLWAKGLKRVFEEIHKNKWVKKLQSGVATVDDLLNEYPILKKIAGPVVAGILFYIWLNMTFVGDLDYDFNFSTMFAALSGSFSLSDIFASPEGLMLISLFFTGSFVSVPWLGTSTANLILALVYTAITKVKNVDKAQLERLKSKIKIS